MNLNSFKLLLQASCVERGFNVHSASHPNSARARIGMVGYSSSCQSSASSRLGFGTQGVVDGKEKALTCGYVAGTGSAGSSDVEIYAFGVIFVQ